MVTERYEFRFWQKTCSTENAVWHDNFPYLIIAVVSIVFLHIILLFQYLPPTTELAKLKEFKDQYKDLTEAEQFCVKMSEVKRLLPRLNSLKFKHHYVEMVNDTKPVILIILIVN